MRRFQSSYGSIRGSVDSSFRGTSTSIVSGSTKNREIMGYTRHRNYYGTGLGTGLKNNDFSDYLYNIYIQMYIMMLDISHII